MTIKQYRAFVDRIEGDKAVLLLGSDEQDSAIIPKGYLPAEAGEGSVLSIAIRHESDATEKVAMDVESLITELGRTG